MRKSLTQDEFEKKVLQLERKLAFRRGFWRGVAIGLLVPVLLVFALGVGLYTNRAAVVPWMVDTFMIDYIEDLFAGFPDAYMSFNRDRVLEALDNFTNAVAAKKVDRADFRRIGRLFFSIVKDKKITYQEMDQVLNALNEAAHRKEAKKK